MRRLATVLFASAFLLVPAILLASPAHAQSEVRVSWHVESHAAAHVSWHVEHGSHTVHHSHATPQARAAVADCHRCDRRSRSHRRGERRRAPEPAPVVYPIAESDFAYLLARIRAETFSSDKYRVVDTAAEWHWFTSDQVRRLMVEFTFSSDKIRVLERVAPNIVDPYNGYVVYSALTFSSDKERAEAILRAAAR